MSKCSLAGQILAVVVTGLTTIPKANSPLTNPQLEQNCVGSSASLQILFMCLKFKGVANA